MWRWPAKSTYEPFYRSVSSSAWVWFAGMQKVKSPDKVWLYWQLDRNKAYLYLSVAFIQMLKVCWPPTSRIWIPVSNCIAGYYARGSTAHILGTCGGPCQPQTTRKCVFHRHWCRYCFRWWDQVRFDRLHVAGWWYQLRSHTIDHGSKTFELCWIQNGSSHKFGMWLSADWKWAYD